MSATRGQLRLGESGLTSCPYGAAGRPVSQWGATPTHRLTNTPSWTPSLSTPRTETGDGHANGFGVAPGVRCYRRFDSSRVHETRS